MCEVVSVCMLSENCDATKCVSGSFLVEISVIGDQLNVFSISYDKKSRDSFGAFTLDYELSMDSVISAKMKTDEFVNYAHIETLADNEPIELTIVEQKRLFTQVTIIAGPCGEID